MNSSLPAANASALRDDSPLSLPSDWSASTIAKTCEKPEYGYTASAQRAPVGPKFLRITDIQDGGVDWKNVPHCRCEEGIARRLGLRRGDLLIARIGGTTGKSFLVRDCPEAIFASYLIRLRAKVIDPEFLYFFCQSDLYWRQILASKGEKLKGGVSGSTLSEIVHPLPPPGEQRAIAGVLSKLQAAVELQDRIVATVKDLKAATMAKLFREGLRGEPLKPTEIGEIPESWDVVSLGDHCRITSGGTPSRDRPEYWGGHIRWVKTGEIDYRPIRDTEERITEKGLANSAARVLAPGTLLMAMYGQGVTRGRVAFLEVEAATNQACAALHPAEGLDAGFLYAYLSFAYDRIRQLGHGANQQNLSADLIRTIRFPLPPEIKEQRRLYDIIRLLNSRAIAAEAVRRAQADAFECALERLVSGRLRLDYTCADDTSAANLFSLGGTSRQHGHCERPVRGGSLMALEQPAKTVPEALLAEIVRRVVEAIAPEKIILFGSAARGEMGPDSDLDLLVIKSGVHRREAARTITQRLIGVPIPIDVIVATPEDLSRFGDSIGMIYRPALREGRTVYAARE